MFNKANIIKKSISLSIFLLILNIALLSAFFIFSKKANAQTQINPGEIVINELMWMGSATSTSDEWIELYNTTNQEIDLSGWQLTRIKSDAETLMVTIPDGELISGNSYYLISNFNKEESNINIDPDLTDTDVSLANSKLQIKLYKNDWTNINNLIDTADDGDGTPLAGSNVSPKKSMSRKSPPGDGILEASWCTANTSVNWDSGAEEFGTPGAENVCNTTTSLTTTISGHKYKDTDNNTSTEEYLENPVENWEINLLNQDTQATSTATTSDLGYFEFTNLVPGNYLITEQEKENWTNLTPTSSSFILLSGTNTSTDFINYYNYGSLKIYKYEDFDGFASTTDDTTLLEDWVFKISKIGQDATSTATTTNGCVTFENLEPGNYTITETILDNWYLINPDNRHTFEVTQNQETTINFYNTEYSKISGHKYKDTDNNTSTEEYLENPVENWEINLFDNNSSTDLILISTTTTSDLGYFEFDNLVPGNYLITEQEKENWTNLTPTTTESILLSGTNTSTDFINYQTEQDGSTQSDGANNGGGGGYFNRKGKVELNFDYPKEKDLNQNYLEKIVVSNTGNIVLTNGILTIDLPENKLKLLSANPVWNNFNTTTQTVVWNISTTMVDQELIFEIKVEPLEEGVAETLVNIIFDQDSAESAMKENLILINGTGGAPEEETTNNQQPNEKATTTPEETKQVAGESAFVPKKTTTDKQDEEVAGEFDNSTEEQNYQNQNEEVAGESKQEGKINGASETKPETTIEKCFVCNFWMWVIILILLLSLVTGYYFVLKNKDEL